MVDFLYLNEEDMLKSGVCNISKCIDTMEEVFSLIQKKDYRMGGKNSNEHGLTVSFPSNTNIIDMPVAKPDYRFTAMPSYLGGRFHIVGMKTYGSNTDNIKKGLPRSILMLSLLNAETGIPIAYMSANILSAMRTSAVAGIGAKYLCSSHVFTLAFIGPGTISQYALRTFMQIFPNITTIKVKGRGKKNVNKFREICGSEYPQVQFCECNTNEQACQDADLIFYAATRATNYNDTTRLEYNWLKKGATVITASPVIADEMVFTASDVKIIVDNYEMYSSCGEGQPGPTQKNVWASLGMGVYDAVREGKKRRSQIIDMGDIVCGEKTGREYDDQIIVCVNGGMSVEDVAWGYECYQKAINNNVGTCLELWEDNRDQTILKYMNTYNWFE